MCQTPALAAEVTLQPLRRFPELDAVIIFSDILIVPQAMGLEVIMAKGEGPVLPAPVREPADLARLTMKPDASAAFGYLFEAIRLTVAQLEGAVPLIGFCGGPWTLLSYMVEGGGSKTHELAKTWLYAHPEASHALLAAIADILVDLLVGQYEAGASILQVFESNAGELSPSLFRRFALPYLQRVAEGVRARVPAVEAGGPPLIVFARGGHFAIEALDRETVYDVIGLDWTIEPADAVRRTAPAAATTTEEGRSRARPVVFQGNLDPGALYGPDEVIEAEVRAMVASYGDRPFIANLGWGMHPSHDPRKLGVFFDAVHRVSADLRK